MGYENDVLILIFQEMNTNYVLLWDVQVHVAHRDQFMMETYPSRYILNCTLIY